MFYFCQINVPFCWEIFKIMRCAIVFYRWAYICIIACSIGLDTVLLRKEDYVAVLCLPS